MSEPVNEQGINPAIKKMREVLGTHFSQSAVDDIVLMILDADLIILTTEQRDELFEIKEAKNSVAVNGIDNSYFEMDVRRHVATVVMSQATEFDSITDILHMMKKLYDFIMEGTVPDA